MSNFRRRLMSKVGGDVPPTEGYIQDGLVFHLDGIDKGSDPLAWTDKVGNRKFIYNNCVVKDNHIYFNGIDAYAYKEGNLGISNLGIMEVCFDCEKSYDVSSFIMYPALRDGYYLGIQQNTINIQYGGSNRMFSLNNDKRSTISLNMVIAFQNKKSIPQSNAYGWGYDKSGYTCIGIRLSDDPSRKFPFKGKIHSIRIYDRQLTEEEILHNQQVDIDRFFGTVNPYIHFEDPEVERICIENFSSDGKGVTPEDAAKVESIGTIFKGNTLIKTFNEFKYFTGIRGISGTAGSNRGAFQDCSNLTSISIPKFLKKLGNSTFQNCTSLTNVEIKDYDSVVVENSTFASTSIDISIPNSIKTPVIDTGAFKDCNMLKGELNNSNLETIGIASFRGSSITKINLPNVIQFIGANLGAQNGSFYRNNELKEVILGDKVTKIGIQCFHQCKLLDTFICKTIVPPTLESWALRDTNVNLKIYVPDTSVDAYKAAPNWSALADKIKPLSTYVEPKQ